MATVPSILDSAAATSNASQPANYSVSSGSNKKLFLFVRYNDSTPTLISGVTYGTQSMTEVDGFNGAQNDHGYIFELNNAGIDAASTSAFVITYSSGAPSTTRFISIAVSVQDALQDALTGSEWAQDVANDDPQSVVLTTVDNALGLGWCSDRHGSGTGTTLVWENSWSELIQETSNDSDVDASLANKNVSASSDTVQCNPGNAGASSESAWIYGILVKPIASSAFIGAYNFSTFFGGIK